jgi:hypothetical protein
MSTTLTAIAVVTVGYILAYLLFDRLRDRFGYVGGAEYVVIGFLLGPHVAELLDEQVVQELTPIVSLALGWLGMLLGTYFRLPTMALLKGAHIRIAFTEAVTTFVLALAVLLPILHYVVGYSWADAPIPAVTLAAIATLGAPAAIDAFARKGFGTSPVFPVIQLVARIDALIGVVAFGLVLAVFHRGEVAPTVRPPTATEWAVINIAVGVASGILFHLFLALRRVGRRDRDRERCGLLSQSLAHLHEPGLGLHSGQHRECPPRREPPTREDRAARVLSAPHLRRRRVECRGGRALVHCPGLHRDPSRRALLGRPATTPRCTPPSTPTSYSPQLWSPFCCSRS